MKHKVEITKKQAEKLIAAGLYVDIKYYFWVDTVDGAEPVPEEPPKGKRKPGLTRSSPKRPKASGSAVFVLNRQKKNLTTLFPGSINDAVRQYASTVIHFLLSNEGADRDQLAELLVQRHERLKSAKNPKTAASSYISKMYQAGLLDVKGEK